MANTLYDEARRLFLTAGINWGVGGNDFKVILVKESFKASAAAVTLKTANEIPGVQRVPEDSPGVAISNPIAETNGAANGDDVTFTSVSGAQIGGIAIFRDAGTADDADNELVAWIDSAAGLPITPNGGDIIITWDNGVNKIFRL